MFISDLIFRQSVRDQQRIIALRITRNGITDNSRIISITLRVFAAISLSLLMGFRYGIGTDYFYSYVPSFDLVHGGGVSHYEPLFNAFIKVVAMLTDDYRWFFFIEAFIFIAVIFTAIGILYDYFTFPIALLLFGYHFLRAFCFMAQYLAMAFTLLAIALYIKKRYILSSAVLAIAVLNHLSSLVLLIIPLSDLLFHFKLPKLSRYLISAFPILALALSGSVVSILNKLYLGTRFSYYESSWFNNDYLDKTLIIINALFWILGIVLLIIQNPEIENTPLDIFLVLQSIGLSLSLLQGSLPLLYRIIWFFMFPQVILLLKLLDSEKGNRLFILILKIVIIILFAIWMVMRPMKNNTDMVVPYVSIWG
ncbi:EpsG family protein [Bifidobacterium tibiigranuli]|uniref:EpsG family protein n=1 Tax=Bifidobacterium tibiigranuli TaxID=2172043 RepID=UPI00235405D0|nr:EpsG family protein [Bifidobacterium tibiigranuli]MCI1210900.1 EpsG family protein [Bifidobacterium tibiigranuli]MCI1220533.1 EpsG family protein [Bifidobacterium tibiigranuli]